MPFLPLMDSLGYAAATLTTVSFLPQVWLTFRTRNVSGISLGMYSVFTLGVSLWLIYGVMLMAWPLILANTITLLLAVSILWMKFCFEPGDTRSTNGSRAFPD